MCSGLIGMTQRSWPVAATSDGGSSVLAASDSSSDSPGADRRDHRQAAETRCPARRTNSFAPAMCCAAVEAPFRWSLRFDCAVQIVPRPAFRAPRQ